MSPARLHAAPAGTAFTYQGQLKVDGIPAKGVFNLQFRLFDASTNGRQIGPVVQQDGLRIEGGLFTVQLDFGDGSFNGSARWLEVSVAHAPRVDYTVLTPRQALTPAPYALYALDGPSSTGGFWAASGTDIYNTNTGNVGIGTTTPATRLSLAGDESSSAATGVLGIISPAGPAVHFMTMDGNEINGWAGLHLNPDTATDIRLATGGGDVGIGTSSPQAKLHVEGGADAQPDAGGSVVIGPVSGANLAIDGNEIMARNNGAPSSLYLNNGGGMVMVSNGSWMEPSLAVLGNGQGKMNAPLQVLNMQGNQGIAARLFNNSNFATAHVENGGTGEVLWLHRADLSGPFIVAYNEQTDTRPFQVDGDGRTTVKTLQTTGGADAEPGSGGSVVIGAVSGANLAIDSNEIMARNNGAPDTLYLNNDGGKVIVGNVSWMQPSLVVYGNGQGKTNAPLQVLNMQGNQGMAAWLENGSNFATAHVENAGSGEVLWLARRNSSGPFIVAYNEQTATRPFQVDADGRTTVTVLQITGGADLSEQFRVGDAKRKPAAGMVVSIDPQNPGDLVVSSRAYDRTVAGVISGAGGVKPGMMMGQADSIADGDHPVALTGRVWCLCESSNGPIQPGDMLTTSDVAGHAMKVTDYERAHGATIGKAMTSLADSETGLVLVLVNLQ